MRFFLRPYSLIVVTLLLSLAGWLFPDVPGLRRGFNERELVTPVAVLILILWYAFLTITSFIGFHSGRALPALVHQERRGTDWAPLTSVLPYVAFTALAVIGTCFTYATIASRGALAAYIANAGAQSANVLKDALYDDYSIGLLSLRYAGVISGAIAFYRVMRSGRVGWLEVVNVTVVLAISFLSGRMLLLWTVCGALGSFTLLEDPKVRQRAAKVLWQVGLVAVALLWLLNYSRNHLYYRAVGSDSFLLSGAGEALSYLGTPIQVSLGLANHWTEALHGADPATLVEYEQSLTTNSALAQLLPTAGEYAFPLAGAQCLIFGAIAGWCSRQRRSYFFFGFPVLAYGFAELWRLDLFAYGIYYCLVILVLTIPLLLGGSWLAPAVSGNRSPRWVAIATRSR